MKNLTDDRPISLHIPRLVDDLTFAELGFFEIRLYDVWYFRRFPSSEKVKRIWEVQFAKWPSKKGNDF